MSYRPGVYEKGEIEFLNLFREVLERCSDGRVGALTFYIGIVKERGKEEKKVIELEIESYKEQANKAIERICIEEKEKHGVEFVGVWHLIGKFGVGEPLVLVAVAGESRKEVFPALRETVERYKKEPALFKKEVYEDGSHKWIEG